MNYNYLSGYNPQTQSIVYVQGIEGAKAYPVVAGNTVILMDSESSCFYRKSADYNGIPSLRIFDYKEREASPKPEYVTRKEFDELVDKINDLKGEEDE